MPRVKLPEGSVRQVVPLWEEPDERPDPAVRGTRPGDVSQEKFHLIAHASDVVDETRRQEQRLDPSLNGMRWVLLRDRKDLNATERVELDKLTRRMTGSGLSEPGTAVSSHARCIRAYSPMSCAVCCW